MNDNKRLISINLKFEYIYFILFIGVYFLPKKYKNLMNIIIMSQFNLSHIFV